MKWYQIVMAALLLLQVWINVRRVVKLETPTWATLGVFFVIAWTIGYALLLHAGGFW